MTENLKKWIELVSSDPQLQEQIKALQNEKPDQRLQKETELAAQHGIVLTQADYRPVGELSDDELDAVSGGDNGTCICVAAGGGGGKDSKNGKTYGCACVLFGAGGDGSVQPYMNCLCMIGGDGMG